jgi:hypothetical protein
LVRTRANRPQTPEREIPADADKWTIDKAIGFVAATKHRRYRQWTEREDITQELWVYALSGGKPHFDRWFATGDTHRVLLALHGAAKRYCEREKAYKSGYDPEDVEWYEPESVAALVPLALDPLFDGRVEEESPDTPRRRSDLSEGGTLVAMVVDVRKAIAATGVTGSYDPNDVVGKRNLEALAAWLGWRPYTPGYERRATR